MRFKLTLQIQPEVMGRELPINYQYPLQAAIYHTATSKKGNDSSSSRSPT